MSIDDGSWTSPAEIPDGLRYRRYMRSREWAERKRPVKERSRGICERCHFARARHVHHLHYLNRYAEPPEDLQHLCEECHCFLHGMSDYDPQEFVRWT